MIIKNFALACTLFAWVPLATLAQSEGPATESPKFFIKAYGGYGFVTPGSFRLTSAVGTSFTVESTGLGAGFHFGGGVGVILNDFLNLGVDAEYLKSNTLKASSSYLGVLGSGVSRDTIGFSTLSIIPNITFKAISKPGYLIYTRIGILLAVHTQSTHNTYDSSDLVTNHPYPIVATATQTKYSYNLNVGVQAALGVQIRITDNLRGFVELVGNYLPVTPASSVTNFSSNYYNPGPTYQTTASGKINVTYKKSGDTANGQGAASTFDVNYVGLNLGVTYRF
jgi:hypothetical protein